MADWVQMRRSNRAMAREDAESMLGTAQVGRLATLSESGYPYVVPVNFAYSDGRIYFHSARSGHKLDNIVGEPRVSFVVDEQHAIVQGPDPCNFSTDYRSVICFGRARILTEESEIVAGLNHLMRKYGGVEFEPAGYSSLDRVAVVEIRIEHLTGKALS